MLVWKEHMHITSYEIEGLINGPIGVQHQSLDLGFTTLNHEFVN